MRLSREFRDVVLDVYPALAVSADVMARSGLLPLTSAAVLLYSAALLGLQLSVDGRCSSASCSLALYPPVNTNCSVAPEKSVSWDIRNFTVDTDTRFNYGPGTLGKATFLIKNTANGYQFKCEQGSGKTSRSPNQWLQNGQVWYGCNVFCFGAEHYPEEDPPLDTSFHFDLDSKALTVNQSWVCGDTGGDRS